MGLDISLFKSAICESFDAIESFEWLSILLRMVCQVRLLNKGLFDLRFKIFDLKVSGLVYNKSIFGSHST